MSNPEVVLKGDKKPDRENKIEITESNPWVQTDYKIYELLFDLCPTEIDEKVMDLMIDEVREHILNQFENRAICQKEDVFEHMEDDDEDVDDIEYLEELYGMGEGLGADFPMDFSDPDDEFNIL